MSGRSEQSCDEAGAGRAPGAPPAAPVRIAVVGGGIAGLAAAHRLLELAPRLGVTVDLTLCEARARLGGVVGTEHAGGYVIEAGPDAFLTEKPWARDLCRRLGLAGRLIAMEPANRRTFVVWGGRLHPLPDGFALLAPTRLGPLLRSRLFTWRGKARMTMDLVLPRRPADGDESLAAFVTRRLGREVLERVAQPMIAGIYTADPETLSLRATMPRFLEMERRHRSVILALRRARRAIARGPRPDGAGRGGMGPAGPSSAAPAGAADPAVEEPHACGPRWSLFSAPAGGMGTLVSALASRLPASAVRLGRRVLGLACVGPGRDTAHGRYRVVLDDGSALLAHGVVLATEAHGAARLVAAVDPELAALLGMIPYASSAVVTLAYRRGQVAHPLDGFGFVVPRAEGLPVLACTFSSMKFAGRAPAGYLLFRVFLGGSLRPGEVDGEDATLASPAARTLADLLGITGPPHLVRVHRHPAAMPQYRVGHLDRVAAIEARAAGHRALALAGGAYRGVGIPDCIHSGETAAERVLQEAAASRGGA